MACLLSVYPPTFHHEARAWRQRGLEAQLGLESILVHLVYWLRLHSFPQRPLLGSVQGGSGCPLSFLGAACPPLAPIPWPWGFALKGTTLDFLISTWTREGPTVLLEKSECSASGSPREGANMSQASTVPQALSCELGI